MQPSIGIPIGLVALVLSVSGALARTGTTITDLGLRAGPSTNTELLLTMPAGVKVYVGACSGPWCKVSWSGHSGYAGKSGLAIGAAPAPRVAARAIYPPPGEIVPIYPPYPYRSGYYPKVDWYFDIPPYTAIEPSFYRRRYYDARAQSLSVHAAYLQGWPLWRRRPDHRCQHEEHKRQS